MDQQRPEPLGRRCRFKRRDSAGSRAPGSRPCVAEAGPDSNCLLLRYGGFVAQPLVWSGMDPLETADKASDLCREKRVSRTCIDAIGVGAALPAEMMRKEGLSVLAVKTSVAATCETERGRFNRMRDQLWWAVRELLRADPDAIKSGYPGSGVAGAHTTR